MKKIEKKIIEEVPIFKKIKKISKIDGGITNQNYMVKNQNDKNFFVRICKDIPEHLISRKNEINSSIAASEINVSPKVIFSNNKLIVFEFVKGKTLDEKDIRDNLIQIIKLIKKVHNQIPNKLKGLPQMFWVFHVVNHYKNFLEVNNSKYKKKLKDLLIISQKIEKISSPYEIIYGHNDLLAANFIKCKKKLYLVDWEYAGFNTPLFDLGGLSSNNNFSEKEEILMLENYFDEKITDLLLQKYYALKTASLLRETMWSMVAELISKIDFDYEKYTEENLTRFQKAFKNLNIKN